MLILLPASLLLLIFNEKWMKYIDPTATTMGADSLSVINFNIFVVTVIFGIAYFLYNVFFHDFFDKGWEKEKLPNHPVAAAVIHLILWLSSLATVAFLILRNI